MVEDPEHVDREATKRKRDRADVVENILQDVESTLDDPKYPVQSEELAEEYNRERDLDALEEELGSEDPMDRP